MQKCNKMRYSTVELKLQLTQFPPLRHFLGQTPSETTGYTRGQTHEKSNKIKLCRFKCEEK